MMPRALAAVVGIATLLGSVDESKHRRQYAPVRTAREKAYRVHANRRRKLALASTRRNRSRT